MNMIDDLKGQVRELEMELDKLEFEAESRERIMK
jgi:hypothetical protein